MKVFYKIYEINGNQYLKILPYREDLAAIDGGEFRTEQDAIDALKDCAFIHKEGWRTPIRAEDVHRMTDAQKNDLMPYEDFTRMNPILEIKKLFRIV